MGEFKGLGLHREKIDVVIKGFKSGSIILNKNEHKDGFKYTVKVADKEIQLMVYINSDGSTSLNHAVGSHHKISLELANEIVNLCKIKEIKINTLTFKKVKLADLENVFELLVTDGKATRQAQTKSTYSTIYKFTGTQGDVVTFSHFSNDTLSIQGKPLELFVHTIDFISEYFPYKEVIEEQIKYYSGNISVGDILTEMQSELPVSFRYIPDKIKSIISPSFALRKAEVLLTDYSAFVFPILRGIEGIIKDLMYKNGVPHLGKHPIGQHFKLVGVSFESDAALKGYIADPKIISILQELYKFYYYQRHILSHVSDVISTSKELTKGEADDIILKAINLIEDNFKKL